MTHTSPLASLARWLLTAALFCSASAWGAERIEVLSYHDHPPFIIAPGQGLTYQLVEELNRLGAPAFEFVVRPVPRARLNLFLQNWIAGRCPGEGCPTAWLVPWVNPLSGFARGEVDFYRWYPLFDDANVIVSLADRPIAYASPESLIGKRLAGIRGHYYVGIDPLVEAGMIERIDGGHVRDNLIKLLRGRVDAVLLPSSTVHYFLNRDLALQARADELFVSPTKHQRYRRHLMIPGGREDLQQLIERLDGHWSSLNNVFAP